MLAAAFLSAFTSNTGTTIVMAPLIMSVAREARVSASTLLLPLAFGASFGGMLTLVGTPPNAIVQGALREATGTSFGFFDFAKASLPFVAAAVLYMMFVGRKQVPARLPPESPSGERMEFRREKMGLSFVVLALVITGMLFEGKLSAYGLGLPIVAMIGAILTVVTRITMKEFTESIEWSSVLLWAACSRWDWPCRRRCSRPPARFLTGVIDNPSPIVLTGVVVVFAGLLAQFMSHTAATSVLAPVCVAIALQLGVSPAPLLMGLCQATSIAVATPIGTPPNVIVYHRGGYRFTDFVRTGLPLFVIGALTLSALIPVFFPF